LEVGSALEENTMSEQPIIDLPVVRSQQQHTVVRLQDQAMSVAEIIGQVKLIQEVMGKVMQEGIHYGRIPGCGDKMTLLQPGAQKLTMTFRLAPEYVVQETNHPGGHKEYRVICTLKSISSGAFVGQGVGVCSTLEAKYRYRGGARKCPECGKEAIIKGKAEYGGGWLCFAKKGGCGAKWADGAAEIESQSIDRVDHDNPADFYNTVLKMSKKRAFVDATITATASSDFLTQDIGDPEDDSPPEQPPKTAQDAPRAAKPQPAAKAPSSPASAKGATAAPAPASQGKTGTEKEWAKFLEACKGKLLSLVTPEDEWAWWRYGCDQNWILPAGESLADAQTAKIFEGFDRNTFKESVKAIVNKHTLAVTAMAENCSVEMRDEIIAGMTPMKRAANPEPAKKNDGTNDKVCPVCASTAIKTHDDLVGVKWCQKCGTQWQDGSTVAYEEHEWMWAKLPFAPKDPAKKSYKGMTLGQIARLDPKYFFGISMNFTAEPFQGRPPSAESVKFGEACEEARKHLRAASNAADTGDNDGAPDSDDVPF
jgi:ssDNA-binding Zn-finger/Zn-ribbon topoisomerase 1